MMSPSLAGLSRAAWGRFSPASASRVALPRRRVGRVSAAPLATAAGGGDVSEGGGRRGPHRYDVAIVGGGPTGLLLSSLLSSHGVPSHVLLDARTEDEVTAHPQAHYVNVRSMEVLKSEVPRVHERVEGLQPPRGEWEGFNFGGCAVGGIRLGRTVHPVMERLGEGTRGDAAFVSPGLEGKGYAAAGSHNDGSDDGPGPDAEARHASDCRPAHLAQNKFVSLLLDEARLRTSEEDESKSKPDGTCGERLRYGEEVVSITGGGDPDPSLVSLRTSLGNSFVARYVVACDGARSPTRSLLGIPMLGDANLQDLVSVHFRTNRALSSILMEREEDRAMLHFVYSGDVVGCLVCHDGGDGEWVLQVPYFPPYQTVEDDFSEGRVREMVWSGLGARKHKGDVPRGGGDAPDLEVLSIRPWRMSSLVAGSYVGGRQPGDDGDDSSWMRNVVLAGDAAHAFPPAGGFGMNTGLQDAHALAWRLATLVRGGGDGWRGDDGRSHNIRDVLLSDYEAERRGVAASNAALSVRNYERTLDVARACYLDADHPSLLVSALDGPPLGLLPLATRRGMFRNLVRAAMAPLRCLEGDAPPPLGGHADRVARNVGRVLGGGGGLPLVFPRHELGFSYGEDGGGDGGGGGNGGDGEDDTAGYVPTLRGGRRLPHVPVELGWTTPGRSPVMSLTGIAAEVRRELVRRGDAPSGGPPHILLVVRGGTSAASAADSYARRPLARVRVGRAPAAVDVDAAAVLVVPSRAALPAAGSPGEGILHVVDAGGGLLRIVREDAGDGEIDEAEVLVRPDGHVVEESGYEVIRRP